MFTLQTLLMLSMSSACCCSSSLLVEVACLIACSRCVCRLASFSLRSAQRVMASLTSRWSSSRRESHHASSSSRLNSKSSNDWNKLFALNDSSLMGLALGSKVKLHIYVYKDSNKDRKIQQLTFLSASSRSCCCLHDSISSALNSESLAQLCSFCSNLKENYQYKLIF